MHGCWAIAVCQRWDRTSHCKAEGIQEATGGLGMGPGIDVPLKGLTPNVPAKGRPPGRSFFLLYPVPHSIASWEKTLRV